MQGWDVDKRTCLVSAPIFIDLIFFTRYRRFFAGKVCVRIFLLRSTNHVLEANRELLSSIHAITRMSESLPKHVLKLNHTKHGQAKLEKRRLV